MADSQDLYVNTSVRQLPRPASPLWQSGVASGHVVHPNTGAVYQAGSEAARTNGAGS